MGKTCMERLEWKEKTHDKISEKKLHQSWIFLGPGQM